MPRLDAARLGAWRDLTTLLAELARGVDDDLLLEWTIPLGWFDVLAALQRLGGRARPVEVAAELRLPPSSLSRRLDRLEEEGWVARHREVDPDDRRVVEVELTRRGRNLWREMNVTYRRAVQARFATHLTDDQVRSIAEVVAALDRLDDDVDDDLEVAEAS
jgi:DNA-binding MarR family transcriptional regulator